jgi:hypothetical protein
MRRISLVQDASSRESAQDTSGKVKKMHAQAAITMHDLRLHGYLDGCAELELH